MAAVHAILHDNGEKKTNDIRVFSSSWSLPISLKKEKSAILLFLVYDPSIDPASCLRIDVKRETKLKMEFIEKIKDKEVMMKRLKDFGKLSSWLV